MLIDGNSGGTKLILGHHIVKTVEMKNYHVLYGVFYCRIATSESLYQEVNLWLGAGGDVSSGSFFYWSFLDLETPCNSVLGQHGEIS